MHVHARAHNNTVAIVPCWPVDAGRAAAAAGAHLGFERYYGSWLTVLQGCWGLLPVVTAGLCLL